MTAFRYEFVESVDMEDVEATLLLATWTVSSLHGESRVRLESGQAFDATQGACVIAADNDVGKDLNRIFVGLLAREFGETSFRVERITEQPA